MEYKIFKQRKSIVLVQFKNMPAISVSEFCNTKLMKYPASEYIKH